jgi:hypothetical protein
MPEYTEEQVEEITKEINNLSHYQMAYLWRFAPAGHIYFDSKAPFYSIFKKRFFEDFGGMTPEISKELSWNE